MQEKLIKDDMALSGVITRGCGGMQSIEEATRLITDKKRLINKGVLIICFLKLSNKNIDFKAYLRVLNY